MDFIEVSISCKPEFRDILIAEIGEVGFNSMIETDAGFNAYMHEEDFEESSLLEIIDRYVSRADLKWKVHVIARKNWNAEWEKNFDPVIIADKCAIRASFHAPITSVPYEIIIDPKMSFGTGHHETTSLMIRNQLKIDHKDRKVLDCGCGTGILSIMASKLHAGSVTGFDIDVWAIENSIQNAELNGIDNIIFLQGTILEIATSDRYDIILANINKNILTDEMSEYAIRLKPGGQLVLSGFYSDDLADINRKAIQNNLNLSHSDSNNDWVGAVFLKD